jgi:NTP pyrophosphatase (non-canonical NTP hydrolase)
MTDVPGGLDLMPGALEKGDEPETAAVAVELAPVNTPFQFRVLGWMMDCFSMEVCLDAIERNHRFLEEALELVQACGCTKSEAHQLVEYVYARDVGEVNQEAGGVMVTLAALCLANDRDMHTAGEVELARVMRPEVMAKIRAKQAAKPRFSPLPEEPLYDVERWTAVERRMATLEARITELLQSNNAFEERARAAERRLKSEVETVSRLMLLITKMMADQGPPPREPSTQEQAEALTMRAT